MGKYIDWKVTNKRYVAFIDIMGFKDFILKFSHNEVYELMKTVNASSKFAANMKWDGSDENLVKVAIYSDSIMMYSKDDSYESFDYLTSSVSSLTNSLLSKSIPFKGAFAFGEMTLDDKNSIFFGQPLVDAYLLQEELYSYGVIFHASVEEEMEKQQFKWPIFTAPYLSNLKRGNVTHQTIYPLNARLKKGDKHKEAHDLLKKGISKLRLKTSGHLRKYIDNTEKYLSFVLEYKR